MNKVMLVGRLTRDVDVHYSTGENSTAMLRNAIAVNRRFKNSEGGYDADFPSIIAFGKTAEFIGQYFHKGDMIGIDGRLTTGSYTNKDGVKVYTTDVTVENVEFVGGKNSGGEQGAAQVSNTAKANDSFMNIPDNVGDDELPFD